MNNQLIMDLELDSEDYLHIPCISFSGVENPFDLTPDRLKIWMYSVIYQIEKKQFDDFHAGIVRLYWESAVRVDNYLVSLSKHISAQPG